MEFVGSVELPASIDAVWAALNDPDVLAAGVRGCESITREDENTLKLHVATRIGPVSAKLDGTVMLCDLDPPHRYRMIGRGIGGMAEHAQGEADVQLRDVEGTTCLSYRIGADVGGTLGRLAGKVIDGAAKRHIEKFFDHVGQEARRFEPSRLPPTHPAQQLEEALGWLDAGHKVAVATVTATWGSAPRPVGSKLLVRDDGHFIGSVSGGCIEGEVITAALDLMNRGEPPHSLDFGVSQADAWRAGLACGGDISVWLEALA